MLVPIEEMWITKSNSPVLGGYQALVSQNRQFRGTGLQNFTTGIKFDFIQNWVLSSIHIMWN
jgi:hypothetical protein